MIDRWQFRSWDHQLDVFHYFDIRNSLGHVQSDISDQQIQQFTGFADANGHKIYEGDILSHVPRYFEADNKVKKAVTFSLGCFYLGDIPLHSYLSYTGTLTENPQLENIEVVGNIFSKQTKPNEQ